MSPINYRRYRFSPAIIHYAAWLYFRFPLNFRDVEDLLAERGIDFSYETVRRWSLTSGQAFAANLRRARARPNTCWDVDEVCVSMNGKRIYLWRAVDAEGEMPDILLQLRRERKAAIKLMRKLLKKQGIIRVAVVTDRLASCQAAYAS